MVEKPESFAEDNIRINVMCIKGELPNDVCDAYTRAKATMDYQTMIDIQSKHAKQAPPTDEKKPSKGPDEQKASNTYKKLTRVLKYQILREEALLNNDHTCVCCGVKFPTRSEYEIDFPNTTYPLVARCNLPIVKYIECRGLYDIKALIQDPIVTDHSFYTPICLNCKPLRFTRSK